MGTKARPSQLRPSPQVQQFQAEQSRRARRPRFKPKDWPDRPRPSADDLTPELRTLVTRANAAMGEARRARRVARDNGDTDEADRLHARICELSDLVHIVMRDHAAPVDALAALMRSAPRPRDPADSRMARLKDLKVR